MHLILKRNGGLFSLLKILVALLFFLNSSLLLREGFIKERSRIIQRSKRLGTVLVDVRHHRIHTLSTNVDMLVSSLTKRSSFLLALI